MPDDVVKLVQKFRRPVVTGVVDVSRPNEHLTVLETHNLLFTSATILLTDHYQSTLGGHNILLEKYVWKNKMPEFYMIIARKIIKIPKFYDICRKN